MKNNTMKRVLAGTLAVLTVAAYVPANVGGFLTGSSGIVADAADTSTVTWSGVGTYITSISTSDTDAIDSDITKRTTSWSFEENKVLTIKSTIPLTFMKGSTTLNKATDSDIDLAAKDTTGDYINKNKYIETEADGVYTYKVLNSGSLVINGKQITVTVNNAGSDVLVLGDSNSVTMTAVDSVDFSTDIDNTTTNVTAGNSEGSIKAYEKGTMKLSSSKAFEVYVKQDTIAEIKNVVAVYDADAGKFVAEAVMPAEGAIVYINKVTPNYTYTNTGTALKATAENAPEVTAASITATYEAKVKKNQDEVNGSSQLYKYDTKTDMATGATVPNESRVVLTFTNDTTGEITSANSGGANQFYTLKITKDGQELADTATPFFDVEGLYGTAAADTATKYSAVKSTSGNHVPDASANTSGTSKLAFSKAGVYKVEYTVYTTSKNASGQTVTSPQKMTYDFTIAPKDLLNESNVRLGVSVPNNTTGDNAKKYLVGSTISEGNELVNKVGIENGVVKIEVTDEWMATKPTITVTPTLFAEADKAAAFTESSTFAAGANTSNGTPKSVTGTTVDNVLNKENTMRVVYNNADYSANDQEIVVKWKLVAAKKAINISYNELNGYTSEQWAKKNSTDTSYFKTTVDSIGTFEEDLLESVTIANGDTAELEYEYVEGYGSSADSEELDEHISGLPTKAGKYSVFFLYENEIVEAVNVEITEHALVAAPTDDQLSYTYGTKKPTTFAYADINGNIIKDAGVKNENIEYRQALKLSAKQCQKITVAGKITINDTVDSVAVDVTNADVYTIGSDKYIAKPTEAGIVDIAGDYVPAGNYILTIKAQDGATTVAKEGYSLQKATFAVTVAKKALTADMVTITPMTYTGSSIVPSTNNMVVYDKETKQTVANCTFAGGTTSASAVGTYTIGVQAPSNSNYTGKVNASWSIVNPAVDEKMNGLVFDEAKTTIKDNGRIQFKVKRPADSQFANGVAQFGVIYDKTGTLKAPTKNKNGKYPRTGNATKDAITKHITYTNTTDFLAKDEFDNAAKNLQIGNGFLVGKQDPSLVTDKTVYGANVSVVDVETGCWFRPYVIDGKGNIYYGEVCYVNLVQEATDALQLKLANYSSATPTAVLTKDEAKKDQSATVLANKKWRDDVKIGYNEKNAKYYVYGSYTLEGNELVQESAVQGFGVVVDKTGAFTPADVNGNGVSVDDANLTVADGLKLGKGFIEGKAGSDKMEADEYGANITPSNTVTGVWVRAYVDLGKNLIVYTPPVYIKDVSSIYNVAGANGKPVTLAAARDAADDAWAKEHNSNTVTFTTDTLKQRVNVNSGVIHANATLKQSGVIVDKTGSFLTKDATGVYLTNSSDYASGDAATKFATAKSKMILGNGYLQGRRAVDSQGAYTATFSQDKYRPTASAAETNIPAVIRPFSVYELNGNEIVIYGDPVVTTVNSYAES